MFFDVVLLVIKILWEKVYSVIYSAHSMTFAKVDIYFTS